MQVAQVDHVAQSFDEVFVEHRLIHFYIKEPNLKSRLLELLRGLDEKLPLFVAIGTQPSSGSSQARVGTPTRLRR